MRGPVNFNLTVGQMLKLRFKWMLSSVLFFFINLGIIFLVLSIVVFLYFLPAVFGDKPSTAKPPPAAHQQHPRHQ